MDPMNQCKPWEHSFTRRKLLGGAAAGSCALGLGGLGGLVQPVVAEQLKKKEKQVLFIWIDGGMSQLESWDPKPNTQQPDGRRRARLDPDRDHRERHVRRRVRLPRERLGREVRRLPRALPRSQGRR